MVKLARSTPHLNRAIGNTQSRSGPTQVAVFRIDRYSNSSPRSRLTDLLETYSEPDRLRDGSLEVIVRPDPVGLVRCRTIVLW